METTSAFEAPWIEKYRPELLRDVVGNSEAVSRLSAIAKLGNLPNIILGMLTNDLVVGNLFFSSILFLCTFH